MGPLDAEMIAVEVQNSTFTYTALPLVFLPKASIRLLLAAVGALKFSSSALRLKLLFGILIKTLAFGYDFGDSNNLSSIIGPIPWGHSGPLCHALSLLSSSLSLSWTSMRRRRTCDSGGVRQ